MPASAAADNRGSLDLQQYAWTREAHDGNQCARRIMAGLELRRAYIDERIAIARITDVDGHRHDVGERTAKCCEPLLDHSENLVSLRLEVSSKRTTVRIDRRRYASEPDRLAPLGRNGGRVRSTLRPIQS